MLGTNLYFSASLIENIKITYNQKSEESVIKVYLKTSIYENFPTLLKQNSK